MVKRFSFKRWFKKTICMTLFPALPLLACLTLTDTAQAQDYDPLRQTISQCNSASQSDKDMLTGWVNTVDVSLFPPGQEITIIATKHLELLNCLVDFYLPDECQSAARGNVAEITLDYHVNANPTPTEVCTYNCDEVELAPNSCKVELLVTTSDNKVIRSNESHIDSASPAIFLSAKTSEPPGKVEWFYELENRLSLEGLEAEIDFIVFKKSADGTSGSLLRASPDNNREELKIVVVFTTDDGEKCEDHTVIDFEAAFTGFR